MICFYNVSYICRHLGASCYEPDTPTTVLLWTCFYPDFDGYSTHFLVSLFVFNISGANGCVSGALSTTLRIKIDNTSCSLFFSPLFEKIPHFIAVLMLSIAKNDCKVQHNLCKWLLNA